MLIVVGQDRFIIEHIHGVYKCINQALLKITVCWVTMPELLKPCRHLFAGKLRLLQFSSLDILTRISSFCASRSSSRCLVDGVKIPCSMAFRRFEIADSVSASCERSAGVVVSSCSYITRIASISLLIFSSSMTRCIVRQTTTRSIQSLRTAFLLQPFRRFAPPHL